MQHGLNEPEFCQRCGCPQFVIIKQWPVLGKIHAVWRCTHCNASNRSVTENDFMKKKQAADAPTETKSTPEPKPAKGKTNGRRRRRQAPD